MHTGTLLIFHGRWGEIDFPKALTYPEVAPFGGWLRSHGWLTTKTGIRPDHYPVTRRSAGRETGLMSAERIGGPSGTRARPVKAKERLAIA